MNKKSFLDSFRIGDTVSITIQKWMGKHGKITFLTSYYAKVEDFDGDVFLIERVEDIKHG